MSTGNGGIGAQLYGLLPEVYRGRDNGDLRAYLESCGEVLDLVRGVIGQRLADSFADHPDAQDWALPYLAELLDVRLLSPGEAEQRQELSQAVALRQRKGTAGALEQVVRALGQYAWETDDPRLEPAMPVYLQEGWKRVAVTPRVGQPLPAPETVGALPPQSEGPLPVVRHPALPAVMVDFRRVSRKVALPAGPDGSPRRPLQQEPHGVPEAPGHFDDVSLRLPDLRAPTVWQGHAHPRRVVVFTLPRAGFFPAGWEEGDLSAPPAPEDPLRSRPRRRQGPLPAPPGPGEWLLENLIFPDGQLLHVPAGRRLVLRNCVVRADVLIEGGAQAHVLEDCIVRGRLRLTSGTLTARRCALSELSVETGSAEAPAATVHDSLLWSVRSQALVALLNVTVLDLRTARCWANDSLFTGPFEVTEGSATGLLNCFRYCRVPPEVLGAYTASGEAFECTDGVPAFRNTDFGLPGAGVLEAGSGARLLDGAEDGGELGAYHHRHYALRDQAVLTRVRESLPAGMSAVLVPDERLILPLPVATPSTPES